MCLSGFDSQPNLFVRSFFLLVKVTCWIRNSIQTSLSFFRVTHSFVFLHLYFLFSCFTCKVDWKLVGKRDVYLKSSTESHRKKQIYSRDRKKILTLFLEVDFIKGTLICVFQTLIYYRQFVTSLLHEEKENLLSLFFFSD